MILVLASMYILNKYDGILLSFIKEEINNETDKISATDFEKESIWE